MKNLFTSPIFWIVFIILVIMYYRWIMCKKNNCRQVECVVAPCPPVCTPCNFFTGQNQPNKTPAQPSGYYINMGKCYKEWVAPPPPWGYIMGKGPDIEVDMCKCNKTC